MSTPAPGRPGDRVEVLAVDGLGEVRAGDDLATLLLHALDAPTSPTTGLRDGDLVVVTSKVVSKAEGRVVRGERPDLLAAETDREVARRGSTAIVRTHHGLVLAAAGIDASNTEVGTVVLLPLDPDASARRLRERLLTVAGLNVAVLVTDTAGRAWRTGQTDIAVGAAGLAVLHDYAGRRDPHGNALRVTMPAVADEVAAAADLVKGKVAQRPVALVRGLGHLVAPPGDHGPGARALVRPEAEDMFGWGAREAVAAALDGAPAGRGFGTPVPPVELVTRLRELAGPGADLVNDEHGVRAALTGDARAQGATEVRLRALAVALGWRTGDGGPRGLLRFLPRTP